MTGEAAARRTAYITAKNQSLKHRAEQSTAR